MELAKIEFALGEFAAFEFGYESRALAVEASFHGAGAAVVIPAVSVDANTGFAGAGVATVAPAVAAVNNLVMTSAGFALVDTTTTTLRVARFGGSSLASVLFGSADLRQAAFSTPGVTVVEFFSLDGIGFDIRAGAEVLFVSAVTSNHNGVFEGSSTPAFVGSAFADVQALSAGISEMAAGAHAYANGSMSAPGQAQVQMVGQRVATTDLASSGVAQFLGRPLALQQVLMQAQGSSVVDMLANPKLRVYAQWEGTGAADVSILTAPFQYVGVDYQGAGVGQLSGAIQRVTHRTFTLQGYATADWLRGRQVLPFLVASLDAVERPEEMRAVERPEEIRVAEWI